MDFENRDEHSKEDTDDKIAFRWAIGIRIVAFGAVVAVLLYKIVQSEFRL